MVPYRVSRHKQHFLFVKSERIQIRAFYNLHSGVSVLCRLITFGCTINAVPFLTQIRIHYTHVRKSCQWPFLNNRFIIDGPNLRNSLESWAYVCCYNVHVMPILKMSGLFLPKFTTQITDVLQLKYAGKSKSLIVLGLTACKSVFYWKQSFCTVGNI